MYNNQRLLESITLLTKILLGYILITTLINLGGLLDYLTLGSNSFLNSIDAYSDIITYFSYHCSWFLPLFLGIFFIAWFYREYSNIQNIFYQNKFRFKPIAAVFAFIIPFFNLFGPFVIMKEILEGHEVYDRKKINSMYLYIWWFGYIGYQIYLQIISLLHIGPNDKPIIYYHYIAANLIGALSLTYLIFILKELRPTVIRNTY